MSEHPSDREIDQFVRHALPTADVLRVDDHLAGCDACRRRALRAGAAGLVEVEEEFVSAGRRATTMLDAPAGPVGTRKRWLLVAAALVCAAGVLFVAARFASIGRDTTSTAPSSAAPSSAATPRADVAGLDALTDAERQMVVEALTRGYAELPASLWQPPAGALMGGPSARPAFAGLAPLRTVTITDRPTFRWQALADAREYVVTVTDERFATVAEGVTRETNWTPTAPLPRGRTYRWQVTARRDRDALTTPAPPEPEARFAVMTAERAERLQQLAVTHPDAHVVRGLLYVQAGAREEAERELSRVAATDAYRPVAATTLSRLRDASPPEP